MSTTRTRPVVVGFDGSDGSTGALRFAIAEALDRDVPLRVVHAVPGRSTTFMDTPLLAEELQFARRAVRDAARAEVERLAPHLTVQVNTGEGPPADVLLEHAANATAVVLGQETKGLVERLLSGGTTERLASRCPAPVFVVPGKWRADRHAAERVVVGLKDSEHSDVLLRAAFAHAATHECAVHVVHAWQLPGRSVDRMELWTHADAWTQEGHRMVEGALAPWRRVHPEVWVRVDVTHGDPASVLVDAAAGASRLLLLRPRSSRLGPNLGHVAHAVLRAADCPVEIVPVTADPLVPLELEVEHDGQMLR